MGKDSTMERMSINYKYNEQELISQFKEYVDKTYEQHYSKISFRQLSLSWMVDTERDSVSETS